MTCVGVCVLLHEGVHVSVTFVGRCVCSVWLVCVCTSVMSVPVYAYMVGTLEYGRCVCVSSVLRSDLCSMR